MMDLMAFIQLLIYRVTLTIVALYGTWIDLVESMKLKHKDEYARLGHIYQEEDDIDNAHESKHYFRLLFGCYSALSDSS